VNSFLKDHFYSQASVQKYRTKISSALGKGKIVLSVSPSFVKLKPVDV
jgi:hypothetical protein